MDRCYACDRKRTRAGQVRPSNPKSLRNQSSRATSIKKFSIIWRKSLPSPPFGPDPAPFIYDGVACTRPVAFASGGRSHCVRYLSGSFDIPRQFAFGKPARGPRVSTPRVRTRPSTHRLGAPIALCLSTNTLMNTPTQATRLLIKLIQNVIPSPNNAEPGAQCTG